jgi:signal transduction histidine kinase/PAS domain-containing protein
MTISASQKLDELRTAPEAAWLWDAARGRVVWANAAGVSAFECQSLFDLIDRPFDQREEGVARVSELANQLKSGDSQSVELAFPSIGRATPFKCVARLHPLADGRAGVLVVEGEAVEAKAEAKIETAPEPPTYSAYDFLPVPVAVIAQDGAVLHMNGLATSLVSGASSSSFRSLIAEPARAALLLHRLQDTELVSSVERVNGRLGLRDVKLTLQRIPSPQGAAYAILTLDDVTERRLIAKDMAKDMPAPAAPSAAAPIQNTANIRIVSSSDTTSPPAVLPLPATKVEAKEERAAAFVEIGKQLNASISVQKVSPAKEKPLHVPQAIRTGLDKSNEALLIVKDGRTQFANSKLAEMFGATADDIVSDTALAQLVAASDAGGTLSYRGKNYDLQARQVPWMGGPAMQYMLSARTEKTPTVAGASGYVISFASRKQTATDATPAAVPQKAPETNTHHRLDPVVRRSAVIIPYPDVPLMPLPRPEAKAEPEPSRIGVGHDAPHGGVGYLQTQPEVGYLTTLSPQDMLRLVDVAADGVFIITSEGRVLDHSLGAHHTFAQKPTQVQDFLTPESRRVLRERLSGFDDADAATRVEGLELLAATQNGGQMPVFATLCLISEKAKDQRFALVLRDISTWRALEEKLDVANTQAAETKQTNTDFLAQVNHELRTPLNAIIGFSEVMQQERFGPLGNAQYQTYVKDIRESGAYLLSIVNDLLELSRVESGKLELNFTAVDLTEVANHAIRMLGEDARKGQVRLRVDIQANLPSVVADLRAMRQIVMNLASNAVKYTNAGGEVVVSAAHGAQGEMVFTVADTGVGMSADQVHVAMEPFGRIRTEGRDVKGTGLGLPLTQALIKANRAQFQLHSEAGKGTRASITFPTTRVLAD